MLNHCELRASGLFSLCASEQSLSPPAEYKLFRAVQLSCYTLHCGTTAVDGVSWTNPRSDP